MWNNYFASVKENGQNIKYIFTKNSQNKKIAKHFAISTAAIEIKTGHKSKEKIIEISQ